MKSSSSNFNMAREHLLQSESFWRLSGKPWKSLSSSVVEENTSFEEPGFFSEMLLRDLGAGFFFLAHLLAETVVDQEVDFSPLA